MKQLVLLIVTALFVVSGCALDPEAGTTPSSPDPDPETPPSVSAPEAMVVANVGGEIRSFNPRSPNAVTTVATDADTGGPGSRVRLSPDGRYVLYNATSTGVLTLVDVASGAVLARLAGNTNEFDFVDSDNVIYASSGYIRNYRISTTEERVLIEHTNFGCDHFPVLSADGGGFIFKNQPDVNNVSLVYADYRPDDPAAATVDTLVSFFNADLSIELEDSLCVNWIAAGSEDVGPHFMFKPRPDAVDEIASYDLQSGTPIQVFSVLNGDGQSVIFGKMLVSPDLSSLLIYGGGGVYLAHLETMDYTQSRVTVQTLYENTAAHTQIACFTPDSRYVVVATPDWIGMYDTSSLERVELDAAAVTASVEDVTATGVLDVDVIDAL